MLYCLKLSAIEVLGVCRLGAAWRLCRCACLRQQSDHALLPACARARSCRAGAATEQALESGTKEKRFELTNLFVNKFVSLCVLSADFTPRMCEGSCEATSEGGDAAVAVRHWQCSSAAQHAERVLLNA